MWTSFEKTNQKVIKFDQKACLKSYIDMNTELRKKAKTDFEKDFFKLINTSAFSKTIENINIKNRTLNL